ncbi:MAG TPA: hypothetical protein VGR26_06140 [Acidimicrobiales bacterium]|nr:hypothetical protein [Acidimicrobiales bacterium]
MTVRSAPEAAASAEAGDDLADVVATLGFVGQDLHEVVSMGLADLVCR